MKICNICQTENEEDSLYCKKCGNPLFEQEKENKKTRKEKAKKKKKVKSKTKVKTKIKKEKSPKEKQKSNFFSKFLIFILLIITIALATILGIFGYHYYQENNIEVPSVLGYPYEEAVALLKTANLSYEKKEKLTKDENEVGIVLKQNKRGGSKTKENTVITLTVGILDTHVEVPNVRGLLLEDAISTLNHIGISYQVIYEESEKDDSIVLKQSIKPGKEIDKTESITLTVSKKETIKEDEIIKEPDNNPQEEVKNEIEKLE